VKATTFGEAVMKTALGLWWTRCSHGRDDDRRAVSRHRTRRDSATCSCRNGKAASLVADGYARATGKPEFCTIIAAPASPTRRPASPRLTAIRNPMLRAYPSVRHTEPRERLGSDPRTRPTSVLPEP